MTLKKKIAITLSALLIFAMLFTACSAMNANPDTILLSTFDETIAVC